ncbi:uncharacterized protein DS421_8g245830 [Arachis hypogaea]|nr:uncharacterized protein DS421_8g245830 [Arachis hypogaea]
MMVKVTLTGAVALSSFSDLLCALFLPDKRQRQWQNQSMAATDEMEPATAGRDGGNSSPFLGSGSHLPLPLLLFFFLEWGVCVMSPCVIFEGKRGGGCLKRVRFRKVVG